MLATAPTHADIVPPTGSRFHLKAIVFVLVATFGLGTWTNISGIWIELPLIVSVLPESWQLPAKLALIINSASVFPIVFVFASLIFKLNTAPFEVPVNFILLCASVTFAIALGFLWDKTDYLFGAEQSVYLMLLTFFTAIADCMSSATFIPFLHRYEPVYLNAYFTGEALTALLPALFGVVQDIGKSNCVPFGNQTYGKLIEVQQQPHFSVRTYFLLISSLPFAALLAFTTLRYMKTGRLKSSTISSKHSQSRVFILMEDINNTDLVQSTIETINRIEKKLAIEKRMTNRVHVSLKSEVGVFLLIIFQCSAMLYGACAGLTTFSLNAYSATTFHYTIIASQFAYPAMIVFGIFVPEVSSRVVYLLYAISTALFVYIFLTAKLSPCPPLVNYTFGHVLIFFVWVFIYITSSYIRILMGTYFRKHLGHRGLVVFGVATQGGALVGAVIVFILSNYFQLFQERDICQKSSQCL